MFRYKLIIEYDGSAFYGFQKQKTLITIQEVVEKAILQLSKTSTKIYCAGRTDTGVHATGQVIHFDLIKDFCSKRLRDALNFYLKDYVVSIISCENLGANSQFHARFSALERIYEYKILNRAAPLTFQKNLFWQIIKPLNLENMQQAANLLIGFHDFSTFRASACQAKTPFKNINSIKITNTNNDVFLLFKAPSFLHHQVRNIIGSLSLVGLAKWSVADFKKAFLARDRTKGGLAAPPQGLYFKEVKY